MVTVGVRSHYIINNFMYKYFIIFGFICASEFLRKSSTYFIINYAGLQFGRTKNLNFMRNYKNLKIQIILKFII